LKNCTISVAVEYIFAPKFTFTLTCRVTKLTFIIDLEREVCNFILLPAVFGLIFEDLWEFCPHVESKGPKPMSYVLNLYLDFVKEHLELKPFAFIFHQIEICNKYEQLLSIY